MAWTAEQQAAIDARGGNLLVSAAAGSGKTAVLVERIIGLVTDPIQPTDIDRLLVVTFTNAAAAEMRQRIGQALQQAAARFPDSAWLARQISLLNRSSVTTLHSFCLDIVRRYFYTLDLEPDFRIMSEAEGDLLRLDILDEMLEERYERGDEALARLVEIYGGERDDEGVKNLILHLYDFAITNPEPDAWIRQVIGLFNISEEISIDDLPWTPLLKDQIGTALRGAARTIGMARQLATAPGGPSVYLSTLHEEEAMLTEAAGKARGSWQGLTDAVLAIGFNKLKPVKKGTDVDDTLKERVQRLRDKAKDVVKKLKGDFFARSSADWLQDLRAVAPAMHSLAELVLKFIDRYQQVKRQKGLVDFADLEHYCLQILTERREDGTLLPSTVAEELREYYTEVLVDEYQDINEVQEAILQLVSRQESDHPNLFMVGDVKQSIYRFRLAKPELFLQKYRCYPTREHGRERKINLAKNFRSRDNIVHAVNYVCRQIFAPEAAEIAYDEEAELKSGAEYPDCEAVDPRDPVELILIEHNAGGETRTSGGEDETGPEEAPISPEEDLDAVTMEARLVAQRIRQILDGEKRLVYDRQTGQYRPATYRDIVVLQRATQNQAEVFLEEFRSCGIPAYAEVGGGYFAATEVQLVLSLLRIIDNPRQDIPLAGVLRSPVVGLTAEDLAEIRLQFPEGTFYEAVRAMALSGVDTPLGKKIAEFWLNLSRWRTVARQEAVSDLIWTLYRETGFFDYAGALPGGNQRQANLRALYDRARQFETSNYRGLYRFMRFVERMMDKGNDLGAARALGENEDVVRIMSIHKSKGLEFPIVFVTGLGRQFNRQDLRDRVLLHKDLGLGPDLVDLATAQCYPTLAKLAVKEKLRRESVAEEMRILYVALTRAREKLILVGGVPQLAKVLDRWAYAIWETGWPLPASELSQASSYLDWLGPALLRHPAGKILRKIGDLPDRPFGESAGDPSCFAVTIMNREKASGTAPILPPPADELFAAMRDFRPYGEPSPYRKEVEKALHWVYPHGKATGQLAKMTVSEIKRRFDRLVREEEPVTEVVYLPALTERPRFIQEKKGLTAAEIGTAVHLVMQHLDLTASLSPEGVREQIARLAADEILTAEQATAVDEHKVAGFFAHPVGKRILACQKIEREIPFSLLIPAAEVDPEIGDGERILLQGVIDCLGDEGDGYVLVDFKTDRTGGKDWPEKLAAYRQQLDLYARAVETIRKRPVKKKYLYLFATGEAVEC